MNAIAARLSGTGLVALATIGITVAWYGTVTCAGTIDAARCRLWDMIQTPAIALTRKGK